MFWNLTMFYYKSNSIQVKGNLISSIKNMVYELTHEFPNKLRLRILENSGKLVKSQFWVEREPSAQSPSHKLKLGNTSQKILLTSLITITSSLQFGV